MLKLENEKIVAILRGVNPKEVLDVTHALYEAGIRVVEVTLNSKGAFESIEKITKEYKGKMIVGAGTVLKASEVDILADIGAEVIISPNLNLEVVKQTKVRNMLSIPGCFTPTECFIASDNGADYLKIFPATSLGLDFFNNIAAVLKTPLVATGGVDAQNINQFLANKNICAVGVGSALYSQSKSLNQISSDAQSLINNSGF